MGSLAAISATLIAMLAGAGQAAHRTARARAAALQADVGQLIVTGYAGTAPPASLLESVRSGRVGSVILFGANTSGGVAATRRSVDALQAAARAGGRPGLLVMTDQEGGEVNRLPGAPALPASEMSDPRVAAAQGTAAAAVLRAAGVNVDLAPVADVARVDGFIASEQRAFGTRPSVVAAAACAFAGALARGGVAYTLKHFPGLGDAVDSTDDGPVSIPESRADLLADGAAYRRCGHGPRALVMLSSASYPHLTGRVPAVLSPYVYDHVLVAEGIDALTISDAFRTPALLDQPDAGRRAVAAGLDLVLDSEGEADAAATARGLRRALARGTLAPGRVRAAAARVLALKRALGLPTG
jgi:beta-N-acetylhexosaminidase